MSAADTNVEWSFALGDLCVSDLLPREEHEEEELKLTGSTAEVLSATP